MCSNDYVELSMGETKNWLGSWNKSQLFRSLEALTSPTIFEIAM